MKIFTEDGKELGRIHNTEYYRGRHAINYEAAFCGRMSVNPGSRLPDEIYFDPFPNLRYREKYILYPDEGEPIAIEIIAIKKKRIKALVSKK